MTRWLTLILLPAIVSTVEARTPPQLADPAVLATIQDDDPNPLPKHAQPWERALERQFRIPSFPRGMPEGRVSTPAEYEGMEGIFIRWGTFTALQTQMVVPLTTAEPPSKVWIAVIDGSQQASASATLQSAGADMNHVQFVLQPCPGNSTCSVWMRDYGPRFIVQNGTRAIVDHQYNRSFRTIDNAFPGLIAGLWGEPLFEIGLEHGGGNYHSVAGGDAFMTQLIVNENIGINGNTDPGVVAQIVTDRYAAYQGVELDITAPFPTNIDSTQHIDMWMLPVDDDAIIIGEYPASTGGSAVPNQVTEATATDLIDRGYTVFRTPGWRAGGAHYTYTNSVIVNQVALICDFGPTYSAQNAQALAVYQQALPDHDIVPVDCSGIIGSAGAIHCIVMHVPDVLFRDPFDL